MNTHCCSCSSCTCCLSISLSPSDSPDYVAEGKSFDLHVIRLYAPHCALAFRRWPTIYMITDMGAVPWLLVNDEWSWRRWQSVWSKYPTNVCKKKTASGHGHGVGQKRRSSLTRPQRQRRWKMVWPLSSNKSIGTKVTHWDLGVCGWISAIAHMSTLALAWIRIVFLEGTVVYSWNKECEILLSTVHAKQQGGRYWPGCHEGGGHWGGEGYWQELAMFRLWSQQSEIKTKWF